MTTETRNACPCPLCIARAEELLGPCVPELAFSALKKRGYTQHEAHAAIRAAVMFRDGYVPVRVPYSWQAEWAECLDCKALITGSLTWGWQRSVYLHVTNGSCPNVRTDRHGRHTPRFTSPKGHSPGINLMSYHKANCRAWDGDVCRCSPSYLAWVATQTPETALATP